MSVNRIINYVRLGEYIELSDERNSSLRYGTDSVRGVSNTKQIQKTKADTFGRDLSTFHIVGRFEFVFNRRTTRNGERLGLGFNDTDKTYIFTEDYVHFRVKDRNILNPTYLYLFFLRDEFDRQVRYKSWGSATEFFNWEDMQDIEIPLPDIKVQQELVDTYNGLKALAEQNEALIEPLSKACEAFTTDCRSKYPNVFLGEYIAQTDERNSDNKYTIDDVRGISILKKLIPTKADMKDVVLTPYKLLRPHEFCYVTVTSRNGGKISLAINDTEETFIVSSSYINFKCIDTNLLLPEFLFLLLSRSEFDRYARFNSWGSARETFDWEEMCRVKIPLPPPEVQQSVVNLYKCLEEAKKIASEAREKLKTLSPALVQRAANS